jgi:regulator of nonsense transcripts 2
MELLGDVELALLGDDDDFDVMSQSVEDDLESETDSDEEHEILDDEENHGVVEEDLEEEEFYSEEDELDDDAESMDEEAYMKQLEDEAFERELRRVTVEALEKGKNSAQSRGKVADSMITGSQFVRKKEKTEDLLRVTTLGGMEGVSFQLLKKGNKGKVEAKQLIVPKDTNLAKRAEKNDGEAARERDMLKARVLQYEAESAEHGEGGGNLYLEQTKLQVIRNRPLTMQEIDQNFGTNRGDRDGAATPGSRRTVGNERSRSQGQGQGPQLQGRGNSSGPGGRGPGRGRGRGGGGRTLRTY